GETLAQDRMRRNRAVSIQSSTTAQDHQQSEGHDATTGERTFLEPIEKLDAVPDRVEPWVERHHNESEPIAFERSNSKWQYGGFVDLAYPLDFNHPQNRLFRSRGTAFRTDGVWLNMAAVYVRKKPSEHSRWGVELTAQAGKDDEFFGFSAT